MRPANRALSVSLIPCPRAATRSSLDLVTILDTLEVSEYLHDDQYVEFSARIGTWKRGGGESHRAAESATGAGQRPHK